MRQTPKNIIFSYSQVVIKLFINTKCYASNSSLERPIWYLLLSFFAQEQLRLCFLLRFVEGMVCTDKNKLIE